MYDNIFDDTTSINGVSHNIDYRVLLQHNEINILSNNKNIILNTLSIITTLGR